ncbi:unnamed protein product [Phytophthora fragariaefolia]|uniref:Unnamed protein product n=1 Tax=Phytophthora fragariaefolia TaxID=1490495 RepID=A0A9W6XT68_9STRA|nr:unnamed protein product [Phytophthora fragariaefolia]
MAPCPRLVVDYHEAMGGVDVYDQLRLQRYSIQRYVRMKKYYKTIFLGLVDIALVNAFIVHKLAMQTNNKPVPTHAEVMRKLHVDLLSQIRVAFTAEQDGLELLAAPATPQSHILQQTKEKNGGKTKSRQWLCKVCSAMAGPGTRSYESRFFCRACSIAKKGRVALCNKARRLDQGSDLTCSHVWHQTWRNGTAVPPHFQDKIRFVSKRRVDDGDSEEDFW